MEPKEIAELIKERYPEDVREIKEFRGQFAVSVKKDRIREILQYLHETPDLYFDHPQDLCGVDYLGKKDNRFEVVYHLYSIKHRHAIRIKAEVPENDSSIDSVMPVWVGANWHERECFDLFGITFKGHPDHRRILLPEDWDGHPLRKDYPLKSDLGDRDWKQYKEVCELAKKNKQYEVK